MDRTGVYRDGADHCGDGVVMTDLSELEALVGRGVEYLNRLGEGGWGDGDLREANAILTDERDALRAALVEAREALKPFVRHGRALGVFGGDDGPFWIMDDRGHRNVPAEDFRRAAVALSKLEASDAQ